MPKITKIVGLNFEEEDGEIFSTSNISPKFGLRG